MSKGEAESLDAEDALREVRSEFVIPRHHGDRECVYLSGNSLGLQPKRVSQYLHMQLDKWSTQAVEAHFTEPTPWLTIDDTVQQSMATVVGAIPSEVVLMNSLTCNLHLMMVAFYRPTKERYKILMEKKAFPSDYHAVASQIQFHGFDPASALIEVSPREGESCLCIEDIENCIRLHGDALSLVLFSGVQYYTGQVFDMEKITQVAHECGAFAGFDLAHAVGNIPLQLHDWDCDFACWCTYKYLNCGPGSVGGCFVHLKHSLKDNKDFVAFHGWWGHQLSDRFEMKPEFTPCEGAYGYRLSNPPVLLISCVRASLDVYDKVGMEAIRTKSLKLTGYLERLLRQELHSQVEIFTPSDPAQRGCQLSLKFLHSSVETVYERLKTLGIVCDVRKPDVMRVAPAPLYNSFMDVFEFVSALKMILLTA